MDRDSRLIAEAYSSSRSERFVDDLLDDMEVRGDIVEWSRFLSGAEQLPEEMRQVFWDKFLERAKTTEFHD